MIVCHCKGLTDRDITKAVREGACSAQDVSRSCSAGSDCGGCQPVIDEIIAGHSPHEHRDSQPAPVG